MSYSFDLLTEGLFNPSKGHNIYIRDDGSLFGGPSDVEELQAVVYDKLALKFDHNNSFYSLSASTAMTSWESKAIQIPAARQARLIADIENSHADIDYERYYYDKLSNVLLISLNHLPSQEYYEIADNILASVYGRNLTSLMLLNLTII